MKALEELRATVARATPGPWMHDADDNASVQSDCACVERLGADYGPEEVGSMSCDDARAIVAMRNSHDVLVDIAQAAALYRESVLAKRALATSSTMTTDAYQVAVADKRTKGEALFALLEKLGGR